MFATKKSPLAPPLPKGGNTWLKIDVNRKGQQLSPVYTSGRIPSATTSAMSLTLVWPDCLSLRPSSNMVRQ